MMTTMAERTGSLRRVGTASRNHCATASRTRSELAPSTEIGSSRITRSPREPVIEPAETASRKPDAVVSKRPLRFWSRVRRTRSPHKPGTRAR